MTATNHGQEGAMMRTITSTIMLAGLLGTVVACAVDDVPGDESSAADEAVSEAAVSTDVEAELQRTMVAYVEALESNDAAAAEELMSTELLDRIEDRGPNVETSSNLEAFMSRERDKLVRSVGTARARNRKVFVAAEVKQGGSVAAADLTIDGAAVAKQFYFVREEGQYKVNVVPPAFGVLEGNTYVMKNDDAVDRNFSCSGASESTVAGGQTLQKFCNDSCSGFFDGTRFTVGGASADCDYNTWGIDAYIRNNRPVCNDRC